VLEECAPRAQDFTCQRYRYKNGVDEVERTKNRTKVKVRSKVEHVFAGNVLLKLLPAKMSQR
jgi:IS5 family transposase